MKKYNRKYYVARNTPSRMSPSHSIFAVVDPQFPIGGTNPKGGGVNLLFLLVFPKNCTKMKFLTDVGPPEIKTDSLSHTL